MERFLVCEVKAMAMDDQRVPPSQERGKAFAVYKYDEGEYG